MGPAALAWPLRFTEMHINESHPQPELESSSSPVARPRGTDEATFNKGCKHIVVYPDLCSQDEEQMYLHTYPFNQY